MLGVDVQRLLFSGEKVRFTTTPHVRLLVGRLAWRVVQLGILLLALRAARAPLVDQVLAHPLLLELSPGGKPLPVAFWVERACLLLGGLASVAAIVDCVRWDRTRYVVTDQRLLRLEGVFLTLSLDAPLDRIDDMLLVQGPLGRWLGYADIWIVRMSRESSHRFPAARRPIAFKQALQNARLGQARSLRAGPVSTAATASAPRPATARVATARPTTARPAPLPEPDPVGDRGQS